MQTKQTYSSEQAGLLMYQKQFPKFVWEEELQKLKLPHFYLGKDLKINFVLFPFSSYFSLAAFIILGTGCGISFIVFICEQLIALSKK